MTDSTERWLPVVDYEGFYEISDLGNVRSVRHMTAAGWRGGKILTPFPDKDEYLRVNLSRHGKVAQLPVHTLVLRAFVGEPEPGNEARHGPHGKQDNRLPELCWGTILENAEDKRRDGTMACGERQGNAKLRTSDILAIRACAAAGVSQTVIAREFDISQPHVDRIVKRQSWAHVELSS